MGDTPPMPAALLGERAVGERIRKKLPQVTKLAGALRVTSMQYRGE